MTTNSAPTPVETLTQAVHETPVNVALAQSAFAAFNAELTTLDNSAKVAAIDALSSPLNMGVERLEYAGDTTSRDQFLGQASLLNIIRDGATVVATPKSERHGSRRSRTRTEERSMSARKA